MKFRNLNWILNKVFVIISFSLDKTLHCHWLVCGFLSQFWVTLAFLKIPKRSANISLQFVFRRHLRSHGVDNVVEDVESYCQDKGEPSKDKDLGRESWFHLMLVTIHINQEHSVRHTAYCRDCQTRKRQRLDSCFIIYKVQKKLMQDIWTWQQLPFLILKRKS